MASGIPPYGDFFLILASLACILLPAKAAWWFWMATTFVQGVPVFEGGPSWNILGYAALAGAMLGSVLRRFGRAAVRPAQPNSPFLVPPTFSAGYSYLLLIAAGYFCWASLQGWGINASEAFGSFRRVIMYLVAALYGVSLFADRRDGENSRDQFAWGMALLGGAFGLLGLAEFILGRDLLVQGVDTAAALFRINGVAPNPIVYGFHLCFALPFGLYLLATAPRWPTALLAGALVGGIAGAALLTLNRQTLVILVALFGTSFLLMRGRWLPWLWALCFAGALAVSPIIAPKVAARFSTIGSLEQDTSFKLRRDNFRIGMEAAKTSPLTGIGLGQYPFVWLDHRPDNLYYVHYIDKSRLLYLDFGYMQVLVETGVIGLALFVALLVTGAFLCVRRYSLYPGRGDQAPGDSNVANWWAAILLLVLMLTLVSFIQDTLLRPRVWITFALIAATWPTTRGSALKNEATQTAPGAL